MVSIIIIAMKAYTSKQKYVQSSLKLGPINRAFPDNPVPWRERERVNIRVTLLVRYVCLEFLLAEIKAHLTLLKVHSNIFRNLKRKSSIFLSSLGFPFLFLSRPVTPIPDASGLKDLLTLRFLTASF